MYIHINGKHHTLRGLFSTMEPKQHHPDPTRSQVLANIMQVIGCDLETARRSFNSMRQPKSAVIIFDRHTASWHGCEWVNQSTEELGLLTQRRFSSIEKRLLQLEEKPRSDGRKLKQFIDDTKSTLAEIIERLQVLEQALANGVEIQEQPQETETVSQPKGPDTGTTGDPNDPYGFFAAMREPLTDDEQEPS
jgi:hypothetical protein